MGKFQLRELLRIKNGKDHKGLRDGNVPVYGSGGILRYADHYIYDKPSILLPRKGTLDNIQFVTTPFWTVDTAFYTEIFENKVDAYYLYCLLRHLDISCLWTGTGVPSMTSETYYNITLTLPDLPIQQRIAKVLSALDDKIALNRKKIEKLEALAKTIYDYWFVQFDFPDANGRPYKSSGGKMVYSPILKREIPDGWEVEALGKRLCNFSNGINYSQAIEGDKEYRIVNVRDISASSLFIIPNQLNRIILPSSLADRYLIPRDSILIARSGIPGAIRRLGTSGDIIYCGFIICCCTTEKNYLAFLTYFLKALEGSGATRKDSSILDNVSQDMLKRICVFRPPKTLLESFEKTISKIFDDVVKTQEYMGKLTTLRDFLLPPLMNGQVEVGE